MTKLNSTINSVVYINCDTIDTTLQPYCPLEFTQYESLCMNTYHNVSLRPEGPCQHSDTCFGVRARLNAEALK